MPQLQALLNSIPTTVRPLLGGVVGIMVIVAGLMIMTAGRSSQQVAGGLLTLRNVVFGAIIAVIGGGIIVGFLAAGGITVPGMAAGG
jgi:hypothetical protein